MGTTITTRENQTWEEGERTDLITFNAKKYNKKLYKHIKLNSRVIPEIKEQLYSIVKKYWGCFCKEGSKRTIPGYKFSIDTGLVWCRKLQYGPYESNIILDQVQALLNNAWIEKCEGVWGSSIVLAAKPHQGHIQNIGYFIWRMIVSYMKLNGITKPFNFPIPRCGGTISTIGDGSNKFWIVSLYARKGYHQIPVCHIDR